MPKRAPVTKSGWNIYDHKEINSQYLLNILLPSHQTNSLLLKCSLQYLEKKEISSKSERWGEKKLCAKWWGLRKPQKCWSQIGGDRVVLWRKQSCSWALESFSSQPPFASPASGFAQRLGLCPRNHLPCPTSSSSPSFQRLSSNTQLKPPLLRSIFNHQNQSQNRNRIEWNWSF